MKRPQDVLITLDLTVPITVEQPALRELALKHQYNGKYDYMWCDLQGNPHAFRRKRDHQIVVTAHYERFLWSNCIELRWNWPRRFYMRGIVQVEDWDYELYRKLIPDERQFLLGKTICNGGRGFFMKIEDKVRFFASMSNDKSLLYADWVYSPFHNRTPDNTDMEKLKQMQVRERRKTLDIKQIDQKRVDRILDMVAMYGIDYITQADRDYLEAASTMI